MPYASDFVGLLLAQSGDTYVYGHEVSALDDNPDTFDCSELVQWGCARLGVRPVMPDGSWLQVRHCASNDLLIDVEQGIATQGALLFRFGTDPFTGDRPSSSHVAVCLGNHSTIEARGKDWGVGSWTTDRRNWTHAALIPGLEYEAPPRPPQPDGENNAASPWPGRYLAYPPPMTGNDVRDWQSAMNALGWNLTADGVYGAVSQDACRQLQMQTGLQVDGIVGPATWKAAFL